MDLLRLEQQRLLLEKNLKELRASLKQWQTWSAEYEGFKEEIQATPGTLDFVSISQTYPGELVNEKEIRDLAGLNSDSPRTAQTILGMISRRQEYVQQNIDTIQRQFWDAEAKLEELDFASFSAAREGGNGSGLPLTEIHEELDDEGNVISSSLSRPLDSTAQIVHSLRRAGVADQDLDGTTGGADSEEPGVEAAPPRPAIINVDKRSKTITEARVVNGHGQDGPDRPPIRKKSVSFTADTKPPPTPLRQDSEDGKKCVSFNDKVAVMPAAPPPDSRSVSFSAQVEEIPAELTATGTKVKSETDSQIQTDLRTMFKPGEKVHEFNDDEDLAETHVVIPEGESEEDARLRREMLDYHLHEVGHVVAQMELDADDYDLEGDETASASDFASSDYLDEDTPYTSGLSESENESEDEFGRTKKPVIGDDYHKEMQELQRRLIGNLGPAPSDRDLTEMDEDLDPQHVRKLVIREKRSSVSSMSSEGEKKTGSKKRVSFAQDLDVAEPSSKAAKIEGENAEPLADGVLERTPSTAVTMPQPPTSGKVSKFRSARSSPAPSSGAIVTADEIDNYRPSGPAGKIIADNLLERTPTMHKNVAAPSEDEPSDIMQRRELAAEYYRRRNDMIRQQGGFKAPAEEDGEEQLMEEREDGKLKKVSRFRAARIKPS
ncbi:uncharacterized protein CLAFUR5_00722 [Fulvia fulva]|uniref:DUF3835 domain-containing protein n=1 Tax=Passalora fulva TaxID=5499 RepID=A0A9Q8L677_PASFU|nr:uncharacterized protein CLAFUR5_00722 [Fulvia fulva]KAK4637232.1 hypothetical protein CLAFUR0_00721 [Fulvia fulva]UJO11602.1 hypothetical protein CLAFUR5_00722 [Fulvia fulva]